MIIPMSGLRLMSSRPGFLPPLSLAQVLSHVLSSTRRPWHFVSYSALVWSSMVVEIIKVLIVKDSTALDGFCYGAC